MRLAEEIWRRTYTSKLMEAYTLIISRPATALSAPWWTEGVCWRPALEHILQRKKSFFKKKKRLERKEKREKASSYIDDVRPTGKKKKNITRGCIYIRGDELMMIARLASFVFFHQAQRIVPRWPLWVLIELRRTNDRRAGSLRLYWLVLPASRRYTHVDIKVDGCDQVVFLYIEGGSLCRKEKGGG